MTLRLHWLASHRQFTASGFHAMAAAVEQAWPWMFGEPWPGYTVSTPTSCAQ